MGKKKSSVVIGKPLSERIRLKKQIKNAEEEQKKLINKSIQVTKFGDYIRRDLERSISDLTEQLMNAGVYADAKATMDELEVMLKTFTIQLTNMAERIKKATSSRRDRLNILPQLTNSDAFISTIGTEISNKIKELKESFLKSTDEEIKNLDAELIPGLDDELSVLAKEKEDIVGPDPLQIFDAQDVIDIEATEVE